MGGVVAELSMASPAWKRKEKVWAFGSHCWSLLKIRERFWTCKSFQLSSGEFLKQRGFVSRSRWEFSPSFGNLKPKRNAQNVTYYFFSTQIRKKLLCTQAIILAAEWNQRRNIISFIFTQISITWSTSFPSSYSWYVKNVAQSDLQKVLRVRCNSTDWRGFDSRSRHRS